MITCIILAGGLGTRLRSVVSDVPKPMALVQEKPFLEHLMEFYIKKHKMKFIISIGYKGEFISSYFGSNIHGSTIEYVHEEAPLGTGGALNRVLNNTHIEEKLFFVINGDSFVDYNFLEMQDIHIKSMNDLTITTMYANEINRYGGLKVDKNSQQVTSFLSSKCEIGEVANAGIYAFSNNHHIHSTLKNLAPKFSLESDFLPKYILENKVGYYHTDNKFLDIGVPRDYLKANKLFESEHND